MNRVTQETTATAGQVFNAINDRISVLMTIAGTGDIPIDAEEFHARIRLKEADKIRGIVYDVFLKASTPKQEPAQEAEA